MAALTRNVLQWLPKRTAPATVIGSAHFHSASGYLEENKAQQANDGSLGILSTLSTFRTFSTFSNVKFGLPQ